MRFETKSHLPFHLGLKSRWYRLLQYLARMQPVLPTVGVHHLREPAVRKVLLKGMRLREHSAVYGKLTASI